MSHPNGPRTGRPPTYAPHGVVATPHYLASAAGLNTLQSGGSAVDAAIAANAVLCVVYPHMAGLGGDGFWLIAEPGTGRVHGINASGPAARGGLEDCSVAGKWSDATAVPRPAGIPGFACIGSFPCQISAEPRVPRSSTSPGARFFALVSRLPASGGD